MWSRTVTEPCSRSEDCEEASTDHDGRSEASPVALVTGAAQGIGQGIARVLGEAGYIVVLGDVDGELVAGAADQLAASGLGTTGGAARRDPGRDWARAMATDRSRPGAASTCWSTTRGSARGGRSRSTDEALWDQTLAVNLKGAWLGIKAALPLLRKRTRGDRQHRLDPGHAADAGALPLRRSARRGSGA